MATQVTEDALSTWLSNQLANTVDTPYEIEITGISTSWVENSIRKISTALKRNPTKYVDLRSTTIPAFTGMYVYAFEDCTSLVYSPVFSEGTVGFRRAFYGCTNLKEAPAIPSTVTDLYLAFYGCTSLTSAPTIPNGITSLSSCFVGCSSLISAPVIPNSVTNLTSCFYGCTSLTSAPTIPNSVTNMDSTFYNCTSLITAPTIPNNVTNMQACFYKCTSLTTAPTLPSGVTDISSCFGYCTFTTAPTIPNTVTNMGYTFEFCTLLTSAPIIPNSVTHIGNCFIGCTALTTVPVIPSSVTHANSAFRLCTSLKKITDFQVPLNTLKNNSNFASMFYNCPNLEEIGCVIKEDDWYVWRLKYGSNTVEGKIFSADGSYVTINEGTAVSITKSDLQLPILTDELWFPTESDNDIDTTILKMLQYRYGVFKKETIPPDEKTMVLWADDAEHFKTNLPIQPVDEVTIGNMHSVTSDAVAKTYGEIQTGEVSMTLASGQQGGVDVWFPKEFSKIPHVFVAINDTIFPNEAISASVSAINKSYCFIRGYNYYPSALTFKVVWFAVAI